MTDTDPNGIEQHTAGAKLDAGKLRPALIIEGFARALGAVAQVGTYGAAKYTDNGWQSVPDGHKRYTDAMYRHLLAEAQGEAVDAESGIEHAAHAAWNSLARLELMLREKAVRDEISELARLAGAVADMSDRRWDELREKELMQAMEPKPAFAVGEKVKWNSGVWFVHRHGNEPGTYDLRVPGALNITAHGVHAIQLKKVAA